MLPAAPKPIVQSNPRPPPAKRRKTWKSAGRNRKSSSNANASSMLEQSVSQPETGDDTEAHRLYELLKQAHGLQQSQCIVRSTVIGILRQLERGIESNDNQSVACASSPHCTVCYGAWDNDTIAANLPVSCGGAHMICTDCLKQWIESQISAGDVTPWIVTPAPQNTTPLPVDTIVGAGVTD